MQGGLDRLELPTLLAPHKHNLDWILVLLPQCSQFLARRLFEPLLYPLLYPVVAQVKEHPRSCCRVDPADTAESSPTPWCLCIFFMSERCVASLLQVFKGVYSSGCVNVVLI